MKVAQYHAFGGPITVATAPDPAPPPGGVVVAVKGSGVCRSDWHGWQGHDDDITELPHVPGHELAGEIAAVGEGVSGWRVGERVTVPFIFACGTCPECRAGQQQVCDRQEQPGFTMWGAFAEYVPVPYADVNLVRLPEAVGFTEAASMGCRFVTAWRAVVAQGRARPGEWLAVHGCGGVGQSAVMIGVALGMRVIAVDVNPAALEMAEGFGAAVTINARETDDVPGAIADATGGGAHVSLDALGSAVTCRNSVLSLRKRGRHVQVGLLAGDDAEPPIPMGTVIWKELELYGSHGIQAHAYPDPLRLMEAGRLNPAALVTERISLADVPDVMARMTTYDTTGVVVIDRF